MSDQRPKHFSYDEEESETINEGVEQKKTILYWISFLIMFVISCVSSFKILNSTLHYIQGGSADKSIFPMLLSCFSAGTMIFFTVLLALKFFKGSQSIMKYGVPLVCLGIATSLGVFFTNFIAKTMIFPHSILMMNLALSILILVHTFFIPEFNYYADNGEEFDDEEIENEEPLSTDDEANIIETTKVKEDNLDKDEKPSFKKKEKQKDESSNDSSEDDDSEDFL